MKWSKTLAVTAGLLAASMGVQAKQTICVFDLVGKNGDVYSVMKDYQLAAKTGARISSLKSVKMKV